MPQGSRGGLCSFSAQPLRSDLASVVCEKQGPFALPPLALLFRVRHDAFEFEFLGCFLFYADSTLAVCSCNNGASISKRMVTRPAATGVSGGDANSMNRNKQSIKLKGSPQQHAYAAARQHTAANTLPGACRCAL